MKRNVLVKIKSDAKGRYVTLGRKKVYIKPNATQAQIKKWLMSKISTARNKKGSVTQTVNVYTNKPVRRKYTRTVKPKVQPTQQVVTKADTEKVDRLERKISELERALEQKQEQRVVIPARDVERRQRYMEEIRNLRERLKAENDLRNELVKKIRRKTPELSPAVTPSPVERRKVRLTPAIERQKQMLIDEIKARQPRSTVDMSWSLDELRERLKGIEYEQEYKTPSTPPRPTRIRFEPEEKEETFDIDPEEENKILKLAEGEDIEGDGRGDNKLDPRGLSNFQIDNMMKKVPIYLGTISHNEIKTKILPKVKPKSKGAFIVNTDPASKSGSHWQAVYFDATPNGDNSIEFYDSFGDPMDGVLRRDIKALADKLDAGKYLKLKENRIQFQNDRTTNCGFFCVKFILDRLRGKPFPEASGYNDSHAGERHVEDFKSQVGFGYISSGLEDTQTGGLFEVYKTWPNPLQRWMDQNIKITSLAVCRKPISSTIESVLNLLSLGKFSEAKSQSGYDKMFHLYLYVNNTWALERNETVQINSISPDSETELVPIDIGSRNITSKNLLEQALPWAFVPPRRATREQQLEQINRYDPLKNNCQDFVIAVLRGQGLLTPKLQAWIKQDTSQLVKKLPFVTQKFASFTTDLANRARRFFGLGKLE